MGGSEGNARLTAVTAAVLLVLLAGEGATIPIISSALTPHVFLGLLLVPPVLLKLGSTGWRFLGYYRRSPEYIAKGAPHAFLRFLVAPVLVVSTATLFGTGIALAWMNPRGGLVLGLHKASFVIWFGATSLHVLAHAPSLLRRVSARAARAFPGGAARAVLVGAALVGGVAFAWAALPEAHAWAHWAAGSH